MIIKSIPGGISIEYVWDSLNVVNIQRWETQGTICIYKSLWFDASGRKRSNRIITTKTTLRFNRNLEALLQIFWVLSKSIASFERIFAWLAENSWHGELGNNRIASYKHKDSKIRLFARITVKRWTCLNLRSKQVIGALTDISAYLFAYLLSLSSTVNMSSSKNFRNALYLPLYLNLFPINLAIVRMTPARIPAILMVRMTRLKKKKTHRSRNLIILAIKRTTQLNQRSSCVRARERKRRSKSYISCTWSRTQLLYTTNSFLPKANGAWTSSPELAAGSLVFSTLSSTLMRSKLR